MIRVFPGVTMDCFWRSEGQIKVGHVCLIYFCTLLVNLPSAFRWPSMSFIWVSDVLVGKLQKLATICPLILSDWKKCNKNQPSCFVIPNYMYLRHSSRQQHIEYWVDPANQWHWLVEKEISRTRTILGRREKNKTIIDAKARFKEQIANISWCTAYSPVWSAKLQLIRYFINIYTLQNSHIDIFKEVHINIFKNDLFCIT